MAWDDTIGPVPDVVAIDISHNSLTKLPIKIFKLVSLKRFNCSSNKLTELPKEIGQLVSLQTFSCDQNQLTELPKEICHLVSLQKFYCGYNKLTELPKEIGNIGSGRNNINCDELNSSSYNQLVLLQKFYCDNNQLTELPKEIGQLVSLQTFYCYNNKLTELPKEIGQLVSLQIFYCHCNQLTKLPKEIGLLVSLQKFYCSSNQLTELPFEITLLNNLRWFNHSDNEIEYIPPNISRFINRMRNTNHDNGVYNDSQSVHNYSIQESIRKSIQYILSVKPSINYDGLIKSILSNNLLNTQTKEILMEYVDCSDVHSVLNVTFKELLLNVFSIGMSNKNSDEIFTIMNQEMQDAECKCFTGRMSRLVNCLNGFDDNIQITISDNEQIGNVIAQLKKKTNDVEELKEMVKKELSTMGYGEKVIEEWIEYIE